MLVWGWGKLQRGEEETMSDYDLIIVSSDFAGSSATLSFLETAERDMNGKSA